MISPSLVSCFCVTNRIASTVDELKQLPPHRNATLETLYLSMLSSDQQPPHARDAG